MLRDKGKVPMWQMLMLMGVVVTSTFLPSLPQAAAAKSGNTTWLAPLLSLPMLLLLSYVMYRLAGRNPGDNLSDIYSRYLGKIAGKAIMFLHFLTVYILFCVYLRYFCDRMLATVVKNTIRDPIVFLALLIIFLVARHNIRYLINMTYICMLIIGPFMLFLMLLALFKVDVINLLPITASDALPTASSALAVFSVMSVFSSFLLHRRCIQSNSAMLKPMLVFSLVSTLLVMMFFLILIGSLGSDLLSILPMPLFSIVKTLRVAGLIERFDFIIYVWWMMADLPMLMYLMISAKIALRDIFELDSADSLVSPLCLMAFVLALFISNNRTDFFQFITKYLIYLELAAFFIAPLITLLVGKIRKMI